MRYLRCTVIANNIAETRFDGVQLYPFRRNVNLSVRYRVTVIARKSRASRQHRRATFFTKEFANDAPSRNFFLLAELTFLRSSMSDGARVTKDDTADESV